MHSEKVAILHSTLKPVISWIDSKPALKMLLQAIAGSLFLSTSAQMAIDLSFTPVPVSMQTLAVFLLIAMQGKSAVASIALYLAQASMGLPVLAAGKINPLWIMGPTGGYLVGFLLSVYPAALVYGKKPTWISTLISALICQTIILFFGALWLSFMVGVPKAIVVGVAPFVVGNLIKVAMGLGLVFPIQRSKLFLSELFKSVL